MLIDIILAFIAGLVTVGGPCILPLLPVLLGSVTAKRHRLRPLAIVAGFCVSFAAFALLFGVFGSVLGLSRQTWRNAAAVAIICFGTLMVMPGPHSRLMRQMQPLISRLTARGRTRDRGLGSGFLIGSTLGLIWMPCSGPVLGTVLALVVARQHLLQAGLLLLAFAVGAGLPMLLVAYGGQLAVSRVRALVPHASKVQVVFGGAIILVGIGLLAGWESVVRDWFYQQFPFLFFYFGGEMCIG